MMNFRRIAMIPTFNRGLGNTLFCSSMTKGTAATALDKSCYLKIDFKISEESPVFDAVERMAAHNIGCLAVTEGNGSSGKVIGVISERDYLSKVALLGKQSKTTKVSEICTHGKANIVVVQLDDLLDDCMLKMLGRDIRHLLVSDAKGDVVGMLSIKDVVKSILDAQKDEVRKITSYALGSGAFYQE